MPAFQPPTPPDALSREIEDQLLEALITATLPAPSNSGPTPTPALAPTPPPSSSPHSSSPHSSSPHAPPPPSLPVTPSTLAHHFHLSLRLVLDFLAQPSTRARLAAAVEAAQLAEYHRAQRARAKALDALENILDTTEDPVEKRRAASAILRPSRVLPIISALSAQRPAAPHPDASPILLRSKPPSPNPSYTPQQVVYEVLSRLDDNHNPDDNAGLTTLWNFFSREYNEGIDRPHDLEEYLDDPGRDEELTQTQSFILGAPVKTATPNQTAAQPATLVLTTGDTFSVLFHLSLVTDNHNKFRKEWRISDIEFDFDPPDPGKSGHELAHGATRADSS